MAHACATAVGIRRRRAQDEAGGHFRRPAKRRRVPHREARRRAQPRPANGRRPDACAPHPDQGQRADVGSRRESAHRQAARAPRGRRKLRGSRARELRGCIGCERRRSRLAVAGRHRARFRASDGQARGERALAADPHAVRLAPDPGARAAQAGRHEGAPPRGGAQGHSAAQERRAVRRVRAAAARPHVRRVQERRSLTRRTPVTPFQRASPMMSIRCLSRVLCCAAASAAFTTAVAEPRSAPGAFGISAKAEAVVMPLLPDTAPTREIHLAPPLSNEPHAMSKSDIVVDKNRPLRIGYDRLPAAADRRIALARLPWQALSDGSLAARVAVTSPTAAGVRLHIGLSGVAGVIAARFKSTQDSGRVYFADTGALTGAAGYWSPVLEGETAIVEFSLPAGAVPQGDLTVQGVGHLLITAATAKTLQDIGQAEGCEHDVACVEDPLSSLHRAASSVAETVVSDGGFVVLCTATLLNTVPQTGIPYLMTAYHCYDEDHVRTEQEVQDVASSMTTWWFFDATACGSNVPGPYQQVAGGATLVYRAPEIDFVLFRLNTSPPAGAWFSAWDATPVPSGTRALVLHHPE